MTISSSSSLKLGFGTDPAPRMHQRFGTDPAPRLCSRGGADLARSSLVLPRSPPRNASQSEFQRCRFETPCSSTKTAKDHTNNYRRVQLGFFGFTTSTRSMLMVSIAFLRQRATKSKFHDTTLHGFLIGMGFFAYLCFKP